MQSSQPIPARTERDSNTIPIFVTPNQRGCHRIILAVKKGAWRKELHVSGGHLLGHNLSVEGKPDKHKQAQKPNEDCAYEDIELGVGGKCKVTIEFRKAKTFGVMCKYGAETYDFPEKPSDVLFFWPEDAAGEAWNTVGSVAETSANVAASSAPFIACFI